MDGGGGGGLWFHGGGGDQKRLEIVSGRGYCNNGNRVYMTNPAGRSPDSKPVPPTAASAAVKKKKKKPWGFGDPEMKRRKRVARYKVYSVEGRVKASIRNGLQWIRNKCSEIIHGY